MPSLLLLCIFIVHSHCHFALPSLPIQLSASHTIEMAGGNRTQNYFPNGYTNSALNQPVRTVTCRNLMKSHLGGVIFGCKNTTIKECLKLQLFGVAAQHFSFVKNIEPGLPLFLFNYSDRKLHGIFEAASSGQMNINPYAWTTDGTERTQFPAQVQIRIRLQCLALREEQFKPIILDNYFSQNHFWYELDHAQTNKLMCLLSSLAIAPSPCVFAPHNREKWKNVIKSPARREEKDCFDLPDLEVDFPCPGDSSNGGKVDTSYSNDRQFEPSSSKQEIDNQEKDLMLMKLKEMALNLQFSNPSPSGSVEDNPVVNVAKLKLKGVVEEQTMSELKAEEIYFDKSDSCSVVAQLIQDVEELKALNSEHILKMRFLEQKLYEADKEIRQLKQKFLNLESSMSNPSVGMIDVKEIQPSDFDLEESILIVGGYDGFSWLSALDAYAPAQNAIITLSPMNSVRSFAAVAKLNKELYVFGGGDGNLWYDTVQSYDPANNKWSMRPCLSERKGHLASATVNDKIYAIGGGNGIESLSTVEMLDLDVGRWILTQSMLEKRFAVAAAEVEGAIYAVGGYDGSEYLKSVERFDPREHSWTRVEGMNTKRACHTLAALNGKLYAIGGYNGDTMVCSVEIYEPRVGKWEMGEEMKEGRGYSTCAVLHDSIYVIGGVRPGDDISLVQTVERYKDGGEGWEEVESVVVGARCYMSALVL